MWDLSSWPRISRIPCTGRRSLYQWTTGELPRNPCLTWLSSPGDFTLIFEAILFPKKSAFFSFLFFSCMNFGCNPHSIEQPGTINSCLLKTLVSLQRSSSSFRKTANTFWFVTLFGFYPQCISKLEEDILLTHILKSKVENLLIWQQTNIFTSFLWLTTLTPACGCMSKGLVFHFFTVQNLMNCLCAFWETEEWPKLSLQSLNVTGKQNTPILSVLYTRYVRHWTGEVFSLYFVRNL